MRIYVADYGYANSPNLSAVNVERETKQFYFVDYETKQNLLGLGAFYGIRLRKDRVFTELQDALVWLSNRALAFEIQHKAIAKKASKQHSFLSSLVEQQATEEDLANRE